jgi:hypothetical protein
MMFEITKICKFMLMVIVQHSHYLVVTCHFYISNLQIAMLNSHDACYFHLRYCNQKFLLESIDRFSHTICFVIRFEFWAFGSFVACKIKTPWPLYKSPRI